MKHYPNSICTECGLEMIPGAQRWCEFGGLCSWYVPRAIQKFIENLARIG